MQHFFPSNNLCGFLVHEITCLSVNKFLGFISSCIASLYLPELAPFYTSESPGVAGSTCVSQHIAPFPGIWPQNPSLESVCREYSSPGQKPGDCSRSSLTTDPVQGLWFTITS